MNLLEMEGNRLWPYSYKGSLTEQQAQAWGGYPPELPLDQEPSCPEEAMWRIVFLGDLERRARKRHRLLSKIVLAELDHIAQLEEQRIKLERRLRPIQLVKRYEKRAKPQITKDDWLRRMNELSLEELDQVLADLGEIEKGG